MVEKESKGEGMEEVRASVWKFFKHLEDYILEENLSNPLLSKEEAESKACDEATNVYRELFSLDKHSKACGILKNFLRTTLPEKEQEYIMEELLELPEEPPEEEEEKSEENTLQRCFGISNDSMIAFYSCGEKHFQEKDPEKAAEIFRFLTALNPLFSPFWLALGIAEQKLGDYLLAINAFSMAMTTDEKGSFYPYLYSAECYIQVSDYPKARWALEKAEKMLKEEDETTAKSFDAYFSHLEDRLSSL